jgi:enoyl-CoA hydratase
VNANNESLVRLDIADGVATITLDNPSERNTLTAPMVAQIVTAMDRIESDPSIGAIVVTGAPPAQNAGANLGNLQESSAESLGNIYEGFLRIARSDLPTIAAVNGAAVGAGMNLALGCDVRIAGPQTTMATVVFGEVVDGTEAERLGIVHRCVEDDRLLEVAHEMAARAASAPRELVIETKRTIRAMADVATHPEAVARELDPQLWSTRQPFFAERIAALKSQISSKKP